MPSLRAISFARKFQKEYEQKQVDMMSEQGKEEWSKFREENPMEEKEYHQVSPAESEYDQKLDEEEIRQKAKYGKAGKWNIG